MQQDEATSCWSRGSSIGLRLANGSFLLSFTTVSDGEELVFTYKPFLKEI
jgi:hypothetical protein